MALNWRTGGLLVAGIAIGTVIGGWAMLQARKEAVWQPPGATASMGNAPTQVAAAPPVALPAPSAAPVAAQQCETSAIVQRSKEDGRESLQPTPSGATASEVSSLILTGKEAAASGRMRDAEIAFLNACRNAEVIQAKDPLPIADAMYQLGRHYAAVAQSGTGDRKELAARAGRLYTAALQTYRVRYGENGEKTRFATQGLASLQLAGGKPAGPVKAPELAQARPVAPPLAQTQPAPAPAKLAPPPLANVERPPVMAKAPPAAPPPAPVRAVAPPVPAPEIPRAAPPAPQPAAPRQEARRTSPSFDCARARSTSERLICGNEDLARMDRDLGGVYERAKKNSPDPRAFQRESDAQWSAREATCRDEECLRRWYAQRRQQLESQASAPAPRSAAVARTESEAPRRAEAVTRRSDAVPERTAPVPHRTDAATDPDEAVVRAVPPVRRPAPRPVQVEEAPVGPNGVPTAVGNATGDAGDTGR